jgi:hypothetical protein
MRAPFPLHLRVASHVLPLDPSPRSQVVWQVYFAQSWPGGGDNCIAMLGSTMLTQMVCYLTSIGPESISVLGKSAAGFRDSKSMKQVDLKGKAVEASPHAPAPFPGSWA